MKNRKTNLVLCICMVSMIIITLFSFEIVDASEESWAIYWYLCGSDLESDYGAATADLMELLEVDLPENVTVVIETGGAYKLCPSAEAISAFLYHRTRFGHQTDGRYP